MALGSFLFSYLATNQSDRSKWFLSQTGLLPPPSSQQGSDQCQLCGTHYKSRQSQTADHWVGVSRTIYCGYILTLVMDKGCLAALLSRSVFTCTFVTWLLKIHMNMQQISTQITPLLILKPWLRDLNWIVIEVAASFSFFSHLFQKQTKAHIYNVNCLNLTETSLFKGHHFLQPLFSLSAKLV